MALNEAFVSLHSEVVRTESRSAHARENYPTRDDANCLKHTLAWLEEDGRVLIDYRPVHLTTLSNEVELLPPKVRVYCAYSQHIQFCVLQEVLT